MGRKVVSKLCNKCGKEPKYPAQGLCKKCYFEKVHNKWRASRPPLIPVSDLPEEQWAEIDGAKGYMVSNLGRIKSLNYYDEPGREAILKQRATRKNSYMMIDLDKYNWRPLVHRLVATYFVTNPKPKEYDIVLHIDENKQNNRWDNLKWGTLSQNRLDYIESIGRQNLKRKVLTDKQVLEIYNSTDTQQALALKYNVNTSTIWMIKTGYRRSSITGAKNTDLRHQK